MDAKPEEEKPLMSESTSETDLQVDGEETDSIKPSEGSYKLWHVAGQYCKRSCFVRILCGNVLYSQQGSALGCLRYQRAAIGSLYQV